MNTNTQSILIHNPNIPGWAGPEILNVLGTYARAVPDSGAILELGGLFGRSTYTLGKNKRDSVKMITVDIWPNMTLNEIGREYKIHDDQCGKAELALLNSKIMNSNDLQKLSTNDFFELWSTYTKDVVNLTGIKSHTNLDNQSFPMFDLIYHDAAHDYAGVYADLIHWFPKLKSGGILIVDDYCPSGWPGVVQAVDQFVKENDLDTTMVTHRNILLKRKSSKKIGFIGVGKLGQDCAEAIASKGHIVEGYDISPRTPKNFIMRSTIKEVLENKDIVFIAVPTPHDPMYGGELPTSHLSPKDFNYSIAKDILTEVNKHATANQLIVLISTVLPGTTRREFASLIVNAKFVYNPYLIAMGSVAWDMLNPEMVIIGTEDGSVTGSAEELVDFYKTIMENEPRYEVGTWDEAEAIKIFYNTFISAKIGLVNMIQDVAEKQGNINVDVVTGALARSTQRIMGPKYMIAGGPDGGACHPRDNIALRWMASNLELDYDLFGAIMYAREVQTRNLAEKVMSESNGKPIVIVGKAYKPGVEYLEGSGSLLVEHYITNSGSKCYFLDKYTDDMPPADILLQPCVYLLMHDASITYCDSPLKETITKQEISPAPGSVIIDIWRKQSNIPGCRVVHYGNTRK